MSSGEELLDKLAVDVGEAEVPALEPVGQLGVIKPEEMQQSRVQVMDMHLVLGGVEAEVIRLAQGQAPLHAPARHPHAEAIRMMIPAVIASLDHGGAAEFTAPDDESVLEEAALFQVGDEGGAGLVGVSAVLLQVTDEVSVLVPGLVKDLDEPDAALDEAAGEQDGAGEVGLARLDPIKIQDVLRLAGQVHQFRRAGLHAIGHLVGVDSGRDFGVPHHIEPGLVPNNVNTPPVAVNDTATTHSGKLVVSSVTANDSDVNANVLTVTAATLTAGQGTVSFSAGNVSYTPTTSFVGTATIPYTISDGSGGTASATLTVTVTANSAPVAVNDSANADIGTVINIEALDNDSDADSDTLTITAAAKTSGQGSVAIVDNTLEFTAQRRRRDSGCAASSCALRANAGANKRRARRSA